VIEYPTLLVVLPGQEGGARYPLVQAAAAAAQPGAERGTTHAAAGMACPPPPPPRRAAATAAAVMGGGDDGEVDAQEAGLMGLLEEEEAVELQPPPRTGQPLRTGQAADVEQAAAGEDTPLPPPPLVDAAGEAPGL